MLVDRNETENCSPTEMDRRGWQRGGCSDAVVGDEVERSKQMEEEEEQDEEQVFLFFS